jgi:hypothetical protein
MKIVFGASMPTKRTSISQKATTYDTMTSISKIVFEAIAENKNLFPMSKKDFTPLVVKACSKADLSMKKGDIQKLRKELVEKNLMSIENNVIELLSVV